MKRFGWSLLVLSLSAIGGLTNSLIAQVSPGPLARAHRELEGSLKCTKCHGGGAEGMQNKCVSCHRDVAWLAERGRGLHGSVQVKGAKCASCHPDHAGLDFALVKWAEGKPAQFDHRRAGWALEQSHGKAECAECHKPANRASPAAPLATGGHSNWTGLEQTCTSCHEDIHRGALTSRCTACHDAGKWSITPGFNHDTTGYALTGKHREAKCDLCHLAARLPQKRDAAGHAIPVYRPLLHSACTACHDDVHKGQFGANCAGCHSTKSFAEISGSSFDHARTSFPLRGNHASTRCAACHRDFSSDRGRRPASASCAACHAPDPHAGTATILGKPVDCAACHNEQGFATSTFALNRHQASKYPLEGKHAAAKCAACHAREASPAAPTRLGSAKVIMRPAFASCTSCHADDHAGQLAARPRKGDCAECHALTGWTPSRSGGEAHARLSLPLEGRHAAIGCRACHGVNRKGLKPLAASSASLGKAGFAFKGIESQCAECHLDPHGGRFDRSGPVATVGGCLACHDAKSFRPAAVDVAVHDRFRFRLGGAHRATPCASCHKELAGAPTGGLVSTLAASGSRLRLLRFEADTGCASCHASVHGDQFESRKGGGRCEACHSDDSFVPASRFNHDRDAAFALGSGHQRVACSGCHRTAVMVRGVSRMVYRPLSGKCESCHFKKSGGSG